MEKQKIVKVMDGQYKGVICVVLWEDEEELEVGPLIPNSNNSGTIDIEKDKVLEVDNDDRRLKSFLALYKSERRVFPINYGDIVEVETPYSSEETKIIEVENIDYLNRCILHNGELYKFNEVVLVASVSDKIKTEIEWEELSLN